MAGAGRNGGGGGRWSDAGVCFVCLTGNALLRRQVEVFGHVVPGEMGSDEASSGLDARVAKGVDVVENLLATGKRNERTEGVWKYGQEGKGWMKGN
jgi:hypothetical protein